MDRQTVEHLMTRGAFRLGVHDHRKGKISTAIRAKDRWLYEAGRAFAEHAPRELRVWADHRITQDAVAAVLGHASAIFKIAA